MQDRIQQESCSESISPIDPANVNFSDLLPTSTDDTVLKRNIAIMVAHILKKHMPIFFCEIRKWGIKAHNPCYIYRNVTEVKGGKSLINISHSNKLFQ